MLAGARQLHKVGFLPGASLGCSPRGQPSALPALTPSRVRIRARSASDSATIASTLNGSRPTGSVGSCTDLVSRQPIGAGQELTFDYAMRNFTIDHFPAVCQCGAARCRGSVTGWKDVPAARKADYGELVAPYLRTMDDLIRRALRQGAGG